MIIIVGGTAEAEKPVALCPCVISKNEISPIGNHQDFKKLTVSVFYRQPTVFTPNRAQNGAEPLRSAAERWKPSDLRMSSEEAKEAGGGGDEAMGTALRFGCRVPYRNLSSQIVSKDEIAEEITKRFSKSAADTTRPFVDKRVLQEALLALKFDTQFIMKIDPSNEEFLLAHEKKNKQPQEDGIDGSDEPRLRFGKRLDPKLEKEMALKQLSELPTLKRRRKNAEAAAPEPPPAPSVFNEKVLQNLKRSMQKSARHSSLVLKPEAVRSALQRLGVPAQTTEGASEGANPSEEACPFRPAASRIIRRHSSSEDDDSDPDDPKPLLPESGDVEATEAPAEATATEAIKGGATEPKDHPQDNGCPDEVVIEKEMAPNGQDARGVRVMRNRVQKTYPSKRRPMPSNDGPLEGRRTYLSPVMKKQLGRI